MAPWIRTLLAGLAALTLLACTEPALPAFATRTAIPADPMTQADPTLGAAPAVAQPGPSVPPPDVTAAAIPSPLAPLRISDHPLVVDGGQVPIEVLPGDQAFLLSIQAPAEDGLVGISQVTDPAGDIRYLADLRNELLVTDDLHPRLIADAGAVGLYVASTPDQPLIPGRWEVRVASNDDNAHVRVAINPATAGPPRLDIAVWVTAEVAVEGVADAWRAAMNDVLSPHGIAVGRLAVVAAGPAGAQHRFLGVDGLARDVHDACVAAAAATGATPRTAVVILSEQIGEGVLTAGGAAGDPPIAYRNPDGNIAGFAVSSPGTPVVGPASHACVAVAAGTDPTALGDIALHEVLHIAGLADHTTEADGLVFDGLSDTPECHRADVDRDIDLVVSADECADLGADNLMFWTQGGRTLTPQQAWRVRWHPLLSTPAE